MPEPELGKESMTNVLYVLSKWRSCLDLLPSTSSTTTSPASHLLGTSLYLTSAWLSMTGNSFYSPFPNRLCCLLCLDIFWSHMRRLHYLRWVSKLQSTHQPTSASVHTLPCDTQVPLSQMLLKKARWLQIGIRRITFFSFTYLSLFLPCSKM